MASEVPTNELNALVTCGLFTFKRIFTLEAHKLQLTHKVPNKFLMNSPLIVCFIERLKSFMGHFDPKKAYLELADQPANNIPYVDNEDTANTYSIPKLKSDRDKPGP